MPAEHISTKAGAIPTQLDDANRRLKEAIPPYKQAEEGSSAAVQHLSQESIVEAGGPILAGWIQASRQDVLNAGVNPIPPQIVEQLRGYFPDNFLASIQYRSGWGNEVALPANAYRFGDASAITLVDVIMFRNEDEAQNNAHLWAHELSHAQQYAAWGVLDFAKRYVRDFRSVENEAENNAQRFSTWRIQQTQSFVQPVAPQQFSQMSNVCRTYAGPCGLPGPGPLGASCYCQTPYGPIWGTVLP